MWPKDHQQQYSAVSIPQTQEQPSPPSKHAVDSPSSDPAPSSSSSIHSSPAFTQDTPSSSSSSSTALDHLLLRQHLCPHPPSTISLDLHQFMDPYTYRTLHQHIIPPPLFSAALFSTYRHSSMYTSSLRSTVFSNCGDLDDTFIEVGLTSDEVVQLLAQYLPSSLS